MPLDGTNIPTITRALIDGRQAIIELGWIQNYQQTRNGVCMGWGHSWAAVGFLLAAVEEAGADPEAVRTCNITAFNDRQGRTKAEVLAVYDRAIELSFSFAYPR